MESPTANIIRLFHTAAEKYPHHLAIIDGTNRVTYAQLQKQVLAMADRLTKNGLRQGDRVLVFVPMGVSLYRTVLALFHIGATAVFLDAWVSRKRMELCCRLADCRGFVGIFKARVFAWFSPTLRRIPIRLGTALPGKVGRREAAAMADSDVALITFTTGSTGTPKAAKRTHGFLHAQFEALIDTLDPQPTDVDVTILPIVLLLNLGVGATSVIVPYKSSKPEKTDWSQLWQLLIDNPVSRITASPFFVDQLALFAIRYRKKTPAVKKIITGGAPVFPDEALRYLQAFPAASAEIVYGSTEAEPISTVAAETLIATGSPVKGLLVGTVYAGAEVRIISIQDRPIACEDDAALQRYVVPEGTIGEIIIAGPHVLTEYFNNDEALRRNKIFVNGKCWHRTGDGGYLAGDQLYLTGRCNTLIETDQQFIAPFVYEYRMRAIPGVACGTLLMSNDGLAAVVEQLADCSREQITECIYGWGLPITTIHWMRKIPRDPRHHSKIDYEALRKAVITRR